MTLDIDGLSFAPATASLPALIPVIAQDARTGEVLMLGWCDRAALTRTLEDGRLWFFSRSRSRLWLKGETSGNLLRIESIAADCDGDTLLARVRPDGPACHTGARACFGTAPTLRAIADVIERRLERARLDDADTDSYTVRLARDRNLRLKKLGEEATELALACADAERSADGGGARVAAEAADVLYHALVACAAGGVGVESILDELESRLEGGASRSTSAIWRDRAISSPS